MNARSDRTSNRDGRVSPEGMPPRWAIPALAAGYFVAAKLGLTMAFVAEQVTPVWPPTGIALAALVFFGPRVWPGVALGAFYMHVPPHWIAVTVLIMIGLGVATGVSSTRHKDPS